MRLTLLLSSLLFAPSLLAQRVPEVEPNGTAATAQPILVGTQIDATLVAGEQDWFSFSLPTNTRIRIHTTNIDTRIALLDGTGSTYLGIDDDARTNANGYASELALNVAAGAYMVQVVGFTASTTGSYSLDVAEITPVVYDSVEVEPVLGANDTHLTAISTGTLGTSAKRFHGSLVPNVIVHSDSVAGAPANTVLTSVSVTGSVVFSGAVNASAASTTMVTQATVTVPFANPLLNSYTPAMSLLFTSGVNAGLSRPISSSTAFTVTTTAFPAAAGPGDTFDIITGPNTTTVTWAVGLPLANLYVGGNAYSMRMTSGANVGLSRAITINTGPSAFGQAITTAAWPVANGLGDTFDIDCTTNSTMVFCAATALPPGAWNPTTGATSTGHFQVRFTSGANNGLIRQIGGNTGATITLNTSLTSAPVAGDTFVVEQCDTDYYQIVLTAPYTGVWFQVNEGDAPWVYGHRFELYDASGLALQPVGSSALPSFGPQSGTVSTFTPRTSQTRVFPAGTYYLAIRTAPTPFTASLTMPGGIVPFGNYMLEIFTMPMDTGGATVEAEAVGGPNSNSTQATAVPLAFGQVGTGNITLSTGTDPSDWWGPIVVNTPGTVTFQTRRGTTATPLLDSTINLRDSAGTIVLTTTFGNALDAPAPASGMHARATVTFNVPQAYYIEVVSPGTTATTQQGDYDLELSEFIAAPYVAASYTTFASNAGCGTGSLPTLTRQFTSEVPATGALFSRQLTNMTPNSIGLHVLGLSTLAVPLDLAIPFGGTLGACFLNISPDVINTVLTDAVGSVELQILIPGNTALRGFVLWEQGIDLDVSAPNGLYLQPGNYGRILVGERTY